MNWKEFHTGTILTQVGNVGVTEIQDLIIVTSLLSGYLGQEFFQRTVESVHDWEGINIPKDLLSLQLYQVLMYPFFAVAILIGGQTFVATLLSAKNKGYAMAQLIPIIALCTFEWVWLSIDYYKTNTAWVISLFGFTFSVINTKLIICSTTKMRFSVSHCEVYLLGLLTLYFKLFENEFVGTTNDFVFNMAFLFVFLKQCCFLVEVIGEITSYLGIYCLSLKKRKSE